MVDIVFPIQTSKKSSKSENQNYFDVFPYLNEKMDIIYICEAEYLVTLGERYDIEKSYEMKFNFKIACDNKEVIVLDINQQCETNDYAYFFKIFSAAINNRNIKNTIIAFSETCIKDYDEFIKEFDKCNWLVYLPENIHLPNQQNTLIQNNNFPSKMAIPTSFGDLINPSYWLCKEIATNYQAKYKKNFSELQKWIMINMTGIKSAKKLEKCFKITDFHYKNIKINF